MGCLKVVWLKIELERLRGVNGSMIRSAHPFVLLKTKSIIGLSSEDRVRGVDGLLSGWQRLKRKPMKLM